MLSGRWVMTENRDTRHEENTAVESGTNPPRGVTLSINGPWAAEQGPDAEARYVAAIAAIVEHGPTNNLEAVVSRVRHHFGQQNLALADRSVEHLAEQLVRAADGHVNVLGSDGRVLYGSPNASATRHEPGVHGLEDPAHPDRPLLS